MTKKTRIQNRACKIISKNWLISPVMSIQSKRMISNLASKIHSYTVNNKRVSVLLFCWRVFLLCSRPSRWSRPSWQWWSTHSAIVNNNADQLANLSAFYGRMKRAIDFPTENPAAVAAAAAAEPLMPRPWWNVFECHAWICAGGVACVARTTGTNRDN